MPDGYGFLRSSDYNYLSSPDDVYVPNNVIKRYIQVQHLASEVHSQRIRNVYP